MPVADEMILSLMRDLIRILSSSKRRRRRAITRLARQLLRDERGGEVLEYVLIAGLIVAGSIATIACFGTKVLGRWNSVNSKV